MKRMKRALTLSLATLMVFGSVTGNVNVITAYALEKPAEVTEVPDLLPDGVAENVQAAKEASDAAKEAAKDAQQAVEDLNAEASDQTIADVKDQITAAESDAQKAKDDAAQANADATKAIEKAEAQDSAADTAYKEAEEIVADSETAVAAEEKKVEEAADKVLSDTKAANEAAQEKLDKQEEIAKQAKDEAKAALEEALTKDNKEDAQEAVNKANEAAAKANDAVKEAEEIVGDVQKAYDDAKAEYDEAVANAQDVEKKYSADLAAKQDEIAALEAELKAAQDAYDAAKKDAEDAAKLAAQAATAVNDANDTITNEKNRVEGINKDAVAAAKTAEDEAKNAADAAADVANMYVDPAKDTVVDTGKAVEAAQADYDQAVLDEASAKAAADKTYTDAEKAANDAKTAKIDAINAADSSYNKAIDKAKQDYDNCPSWRVASKAYYKLVWESKIADLNDAKEAAQKEYTEAVKAAESAKKNAYTQAENNTTKELNKLTGAKQADAEAKAVVAAEEGIRDTILGAMTDDVKQNQKLIDDVEKELAGEGAQYLEYMNDLNAYLWATDERNDAFASLKWGGKFWSPEALKVELEWKYRDGFFDGIWNVIHPSEVKEEITGKKNTAEELVKDLQQQEATLESKQSALAAAQAKTAAAEAQGVIADQLSEVADAALEVQDAKKEVETAKKDVDKNAEAIRDLEARLNAAKSSYAETLKLSKELETAKLDLTKAQATLKEAEKELEKANSNLEDVKVQAKAAQNFANWANALVTDQVTRSYAQATTEDGKKVPSYKNNLEYDLTDKGVISRPVKNFVEVSIGAASDQVVPYSIYRAYVEAMYNTYSYDELVKGDKGNGKGISTGGTMDVIYWAVGADNKLVGTQPIAEKDLKDGEIYFVGYTFKHEKDGYHIDGVLVKYSDPTPAPTESPEPSESPAPSEEPVPSGSPEPSESPAPSTTPAPTTEPTTAPTTEPGGGDTPEGGDDTPDEGGLVTIEDAPVALAAAPAVAPVEAAEADDAAVLGARRVDANTTDAAVLGAKRGTEFAVLGKRRRPQTGDNAAIWVWASMITLAVCGAGVSVTGLTKNKRKKEEPGK